MYGLEKTVKLQFLIGKELLQLCIGLYQIILNFTDELVINIESTCKLISPEHHSTVISCGTPRTCVELIGLLGTSITKVTNQGDGEVLIFFSNEYCLKLIDNNKDVESYSIAAVDNEIIV